MNKRRLHVEPLEDRRMLAVATVDTELDIVDFTDGVTSLREAIFATNTLLGSDTIEFDPTLVGKTILLTQGEFQITDDLTINGLGANSLTIDASGNDPTPVDQLGDGSRIFNIDNGDNGIDISAAISGLTLTGGDVSDAGGAIFTRENLTLTSSTISGNAAGEDGGGVYSRGADLTIVDSTISGNNTLDFTFFSDGGGVFARGGTVSISDSAFVGNTSYGRAGALRVVNNTVTIERTTFDGNVSTNDWGGAINGSASTMSVNESTFIANQATSPLRAGGGRGGAILIEGQAVLSVNNSTFSDNSARHGGAIAGNSTSPAMLTISHSTIVWNSATRGGGGINTSGILAPVLTHTIVANNQHALDLGPPIDNDIGGSVTADWSLIEAIVGTITGNNNIIQDPQLGPLQNNGGPTFSHALLPGSPAIDMGDPAAAAGVGGVPVADQRGGLYTRVYGGRIDIGAFETQPQHADFDTDGDVDGFDFLAWQRGHGIPAPNAVKADGDADGDTDVDADDLAAWENAFGALPPPFPLAAQPLAANATDAPSVGVVTSLTVETAGDDDEPGVLRAEVVDLAMTPTASPNRSTTDIRAVHEDDFGDIVVSRTPADELLAIELALSTFDALD